MSSPGIPIRPPLTFPHLTSTSPSTSKSTLNQSTPSSSSSSRSTTQNDANGASGGLNRKQRRKRKFGTGVGGEVGVAGGASATGAIDVGTGKWHKNKTGAGSDGNRSPGQVHQSKLKSSPSPKHLQKAPPHNSPKPSSSTSSPTSIQTQPKSHIHTNTHTNLYTPKNLTQTDSSPRSHPPNSSMKKQTKRDRRKKKKVQLGGGEDEDETELEARVELGQGDEGEDSGGSGLVRVDVQDEAGRSVGLNVQDIVPTLSGLIKIVSARLGLDGSKTGLRLVHLRGQGQVVPIFDQPDYKYFLERGRAGGVGVQVLQVQVYPKDVGRSGSGSGGKERKRKRSDSSSEGEEDAGGSDGDSSEDEVEEPVRAKPVSVGKKSSERQAKSKSKQIVQPPPPANPSAKPNKMDQPSSSTPSSSSLNDSTASDPDSPSPAPRRNIIHLGSRFKPVRPSPLGGTVVARSPTASIGTNGSDGEDEDEDEDGDEDVVMEDVEKSAKKNSSSTTPSREKKKQANGRPASADLDGFARAISEFASMLPSVTSNAGSSSSAPQIHAAESSSEEDTDDDELIGEDTILDDESGITAAEAAKAYEQWKATKAKESAAIKQKEEAAAEKKRQKAEAKEQRRKEKAELEAKKAEDKARRKSEAEQASKRKAEDERARLEQAKQEREAQQEKKMQAARLELEALTKRLAEKERLAAEARRQSSSQAEEASDVPARSSGTIAQQTHVDSDSSDSETESETAIETDDVAMTPPSATPQRGLTSQAAANLVASPIPSVVVAPASQEVEGDASSSSSSSDSENESSSDEDDNAEATNTPDPTPLQSVQAVTSIPRPAHLPSSSPEPYSDIEDLEDEAPRQQKGRRRTQRSPSTDGLIPEGDDDDDDDDASSIETTQPLVQFSQLSATPEDIETADERDDPMEVDVVEDFPLPVVSAVESEEAPVKEARQVTPGLTDPDATEDEAEDDPDDVPQSTLLETTDEGLLRSPSPAFAASKTSESISRVSRKSFADLADDIEASSSAVPSTGNQVFFQALQTEADVDQAGIEEAAKERANRDKQSPSAIIADNQLVSDEAAVLQESQSDSMPDSTPTPAPNSRKSKLKAKEALIAQAAELAALNANPNGDDHSTISSSTNRDNAPPVLRSEKEGATSPAVTNQRDASGREPVALADEAASMIEVEIPIAPLPKRRGRPPQAKAPDAIPAGSQPSSATNASRTTASSQDNQRDTVGSSISPKALAIQELDSPPASVTAPLPALPTALSAIDLRNQRLQELQTRKRVGTKPCLICDSIPAHLQKDCPVVIRGLASVEKRLKELKDANASPLAIDALQGWVVRLSNKSQQASKSALPANTTPNKANLGKRANGSQASSIERTAATNGTTPTNGTPSSKRRPGVATRNNIPTLSSLRADALRKPRLAAGITKDAVSTPTTEKASPFARRGRGSDDEESSSGTDSDSDDDGKGPSLPASLAGRMANGIKTAKKAAVGAIGW